MFRSFNKTMKQYHDGHLIVASFVIVIVILSCAALIGWRSLVDYNKTIDDYIAIDEVLDTLTQAQFRIMTYRLDSTTENSFMASEDISQSLSLLMQLENNQFETQMVGNFSPIIAVLKQYQLNFKKLITLQSNSQSAYESFTTSQQNWLDDLASQLSDSSRVESPASSSTMLAAVQTEVKQLQQAINQFYLHSELDQKLNVATTIKQRFNAIASLLSQAENQPIQALSSALQQVIKQFKQLTTNLSLQLTIDNTISSLSTQANAELYTLRNKELISSQQAKQLTTNLIYFGLVFILVIALLTFIVKKSTGSIVRMSHRMKEAKIQADTAYETKSNFIANVSHELRTPMNAIIGLSYLTLQTELDMKQRNYVEKVHQSSESLLALLNNILDYSNIENGKFDLTSSEFNLHDLLANLSNYLLMLIEDKQIELVFDIPLALQSSYVGDPLRLRQILVNIAGNAVKFTERGEVLVAVSKIQQHGDNITLEFMIKDSGVGIKEQDISKLFSTFSQVDTSSTREFGGTGLGLAISKQLIDTMGGDIKVTSVYGQGSTFQFSVQLKVANANQQFTLKPQQSAAIKALIVEDNELARSVLMRILSELNITAQTVTDGVEAVQLFSSPAEQAPFNLIIIDWAMPNMDGLSALHEINNLVKQHGWQQPKAIMTTMYDRQEVYQHPHSSHIDIFLDKPLIAKTVCQAIKLALENDTCEQVIGVEIPDQLYLSAQRVAGANILLVEDNEINRELMINLLANYEISTTIAHHGAEALAALHNAEFDGVLMDCHMPVMDGYQATRKIRQQAKYSQLPIIAITASAMAGDKEKVLQAGMNDHVAKPINASQLFETMAKWITPAQPKALTLKKPQAQSPGLQQTNNTIAAPIDVQKGLEISLGSTELYHDLLGRFLRNETDFANVFKQHLANNDHQTGKLAAHSLRGSAANIGANTLANIAKQLELACDKNFDQATTAPLLSAINNAMEEVKIHIQSMNLPNKASVETHLDEDFDIASECAQLKELLANSDTEAIDQAQQLKAGLENAFSVEQTEPLFTALEQYDFDAALEHLAPLIASIKND